MKVLVARRCSRWHRCGRRAGDEARRRRHAEGSDADQGAARQARRISSARRSASTAWRPRSASTWAAGWRSQRRAEATSRRNSPAEGRGRRDRVPGPRRAGRCRPRACSKPSAKEAESERRAAGEHAEAGHHRVEAYQHQSDRARSSGRPGLSPGLQQPAAREHGPDRLREAPAVVPRDVAGTRNRRRRPRTIPARRLARAAACARRDSGPACRRWARGVHEHHIDRPAERWPISRTASPAVNAHIPCPSVSRLVTRITGP